ncbi:MAG: hypothetical protein ABI199_09935 [Bacteroidia bacterium]
MKSKKYFFATLFLFLSVFVGQVKAQCSVCAASIQSNLQHGGTTGAGLNHAILYLMAIPYLVVSTCLFFYFKDEIFEKFRILKAKYSSHKV